MKRRRRRRSTASEITLKNKSLVVPFALPYLLYVGIASVPAEWLARDWNYVARIVLTGAAIIWAWPRFIPWKGPNSIGLSLGAGIVAGVIGLAAWVGLMMPFVESGEAWEPRGWWLRMAAATIIVPIFEEQFMRGFLLRFGTQWQATKSFDEAFDNQDVRELEPGHMTLWGVALSTAIFTVGHAMIEWPAAIVYGLLMCFLLRWRRDMTSVIVAHATTNLGLALYVSMTGSWGYW